nr:reverse transcriptase domain-containing protein [Tanacetum cinerariifolium]
MEDMMLELIEVFRQKEFYCMHDNVDDLIESALNSKLLLINFDSQRLDKKKQEVKSISPVHAIAPVLPTEEPEYSLSMGYEHLNTTSKTESDEIKKSGVKNLLLIPCEYEVISDDEITFDEDVPTEELKVYLNLLFDDEEISYNEIDQHCFNAESDLIESLLNHNTLIDSSPKFDFLLKEFSGELAHINPKIKEADFNLEEEIRFVESLLYDNSSPRPPEELNAEITDTITTHLKNEISRFTQRFEETFREAWERFKEMLRECPHHGFSELTQIDTFYNGLNEQDQDSLNAMAGGNLLSKTTREALNIIENKSKVCYSRNKPNVSRMNTTSRENTSKTDDRIYKPADQISTVVDIFAKKVVTPALVKAVEESCVNFGGPHAHYNFDATNMSIV